MIRRNSTSADGSDGWILITQREHARVSAQLAEAWRLAPLTVMWQEVVQWTACHHDDGWEAWDASPGLDGQGRPISFMEMAIGDRNAIWSDSIERAAEHGPLAAYQVARHFLELTAVGHSGDEPEADEFRREFEPRAAAWLAMVPEAAAAADVAAGYLQLFDWLSLLLCCGPLQSPANVPLPDRHGDLTLTPQSEWLLQLDPWRMKGPCRVIEAEAAQIPARSYRDVDELRRAARPLALRWELTGASS